MSRQCVRTGISQRKELFHEAEVVRELLTAMQQNDKMEAAKTTAFNTERRERFEAKKDVCVYVCVCQFVKPQYSSLTG